MSPIGLTDRVGRQGKKMASRIEGPSPIGTPHPTTWGVRGGGSPPGKRFFHQKDFLLDVWVYSFAAKEATAEVDEVAAAAVAAAKIVKRNENNKNHLTQTSIKNLFD